MSKKLPNLTKEEYDEVYEAVKNDFYKELDGQALFQEELVEGFSKFAPWISIGVGVVTLLVVIVKGG